MQEPSGLVEQIVEPQSLGFAIETFGLTKSFGGREVVSGVSLKVPQGSIFGFLGPNGSGKTTTIRMLLGLVSPDGGEITLLGLAHNRLSGLGRLGAVVEGPGFYPYLSGIDNLRRFSQVAYPIQKKVRPDSQKLSNANLIETLSRVGLEEAKNKRYRAYSLGMKQRLAIAAALLWPRELLVLDEPTNGLDPQGIVEVRELVTQLQREGMTIFISSHILSEVEMICSDIAIMRDGALLFQGGIGEFKGSLEREFVLESKDVKVAHSILLRNGLCEESSLLVDGDVLRAKLNTSDVEGIVRLLVENHVGIRSVGLATPSLEEAFVELTGRSGHAR